MQYCFLSKIFYDRYGVYKEILQKTDRPYFMLVVQIDNLQVGIPFRSHITHKHAFMTIGDKGLDYSKAVVLSEECYVDRSKKVIIAKDEHSILLGRDGVIKNGFKKYLNAYKKALSNPEVKRNNLLLSMSTLKYFHKELSLERPMKIEKSKSVLEIE